MGPNESCPHRTLLPTFTMGVDLTALNEFLADKTYIVGCAYLCCPARRVGVEGGCGRGRGGASSSFHTPERHDGVRRRYAPSQADVATYDAVGVSPDGFPHVARFHKLMDSFSTAKKLKYGPTQPYLDDGIAPPAAVAPLGTPLPAR